MPIYTILQIYLAMHKYTILQIYLTMPIYMILQNAYLYHFTDIFDNAYLHHYCRHNLTMPIYTIVSDIFDNAYLHHLSESIQDNWCIVANMFGFPHDKIMAAVERRNLDSNNDKNKAFTILHMWKMKQNKDIPVRYHMLILRYSSGFICCNVSFSFNKTYHQYCLFEKG